MDKGIKMSKERWKKGLERQKRVEKGQKERGITLSHCKLKDKLFAQSQLIVI